MARGEFYDLVHSPEMGTPDDGGRFMVVCPHNILIQVADKSNAVYLSNHTDEFCIMCERNRQERLGCDMRITYQGHGKYWVVIPGQVVLANNWDGMYSHERNDWFTYLTSQKRGRGYQIIVEMEPHQIQDLITHLAGLGEDYISNGADEEIREFGYACKYFARDLKSKWESIKSGGDDVQD